MPPSPPVQSIWEWINPQNITVVSLLIFFIVGLMQRWWVMGYQLADMKVERDEAKKLADEWKGMALKNYSLADRTAKESFALISGIGIGGGENRTPGAA